jgi:hypothetical protein
MVGYILKGVKYQRQGYNFEYQVQAIFKIDLCFEQHFGSIPIFDTV